MNEIEQLKAEIADRKARLKELRPIFAIRLQQAREAAGLSRKQLAADCDISTQRIFYYENGMREPNLPTLKNFADVLSVSTDWLLGRTNEPKLSTCCD